MALRFIHWYRVSPLTLDETLGWRASENYRIDGFHENADGTQYPTHITQNEYGFRMFGDVRSKSSKILVIGDSFTHALQVSDDKTYYSYIRDALHTEVFAYGGDGYSTLQEYMILNRYFDLIKPDLLLWQYCENDFINNSAELESESKINNNGLVRPYWMNGEIVYVLPKKYSANIRHFALEYSRLLYLIFSRLDIILGHIHLATVETQIGTEGASHPGFARSVLVTDDLMSKVKARVGHVPVVAFIVGRGYGVDEFRKISSRHGILYLDDVETAIQSAKAKGIVVTARDTAHWNETGHQIAGEVLAKYLKQLCLLDSCNHLAPKKVLRGGATNITLES